jgi:hypothetical protein
MQVPETVCSVVEIPVPSQAKLHKQWCLFDQREGDIDFDKEVRKITGDLEEEEKESQAEIRSTTTPHSKST